MIFPCMPPGRLSGGIHAGNTSPGPFANNHTNEIMKSSPLFFLLSILLGSFGFLSAQDFNAMEPVAWYTLIDSAGDKLGQQPPVKLMNATFEGTDGIYSNGIYPFSGSGNGTLIESPKLPALYEPTFAVSLEFKIDSLDGQNHTIIMLGISWRYLGFTLLFNEKLAIEFNGYTYAIPGIEPKADQWYDFALVYNLLDSTAYYYLDSQLIHEQKGPLIRDDLDDFITNTNFGEGTTFRGHWRNLRVYQSDDLFSSILPLDHHELLQIYPNPVHNQIQIVQQGSACEHWEILDASGRWTGKKGQMTPSTSIDVDDLMPGIYTIIATDKETGKRISHRFIKL